MGYKLMHQLEKARYMIMTFVRGIIPGKTDTWQADLVIVETEILDEAEGDYNDDGPSLIAIARPLDRFEPNCQMFG